jgi:hypothetical protein
LFMPLLVLFLMYLLNIGGFNSICFREKKDSSGYNSTDDLPLPSVNKKIFAAILFFWQSQPRLIFRITVLRENSMHFMRVKPWERLYPIWQGRFHIRIFCFYTGSLRIPFVQSWPLNFSGNRLVQSGPWSLSLKFCYS